MQNKFRFIAVSALASLVALIAGCMVPTGSSSEMLAPWVKQVNTKWTPTVVVLDVKETSELTYYAKIPKKFLFFPYHGWEKLDTKYAWMLDQETMLLDTKEGPSKLMRRNDTQARRVCNSAANITALPSNGNAKTFDCSEFIPGFMQFTRRDFNEKILLEMKIPDGAKERPIVTTTSPVFLYDDAGWPYFLQTSSRSDRRGFYKLRFCRLVTMFDDKFTVYQADDAETEKTASSCHEKKQWELLLGKKLLTPLESHEIQAGHKKRDE